MNDDDFYCLLSLILVFLPVLGDLFVRLILRDRLWVVHYFTHLRVFHTSVSWWFSHGVWVTPQISRTLLSNLADLNNAVVQMISTHPFISKSCTRFSKPLVTVPNVPITTGITVTFMFLCFFCYLAKSWHLSLFLLSFTLPFFVPFYPFSFTFNSFSVSGNDKVHYLEGFFFLLTITGSGRLVIRLYLKISFSWTDSGLCIYHLFVWQNLYYY